MIPFEQITIIGLDSLGLSLALCLEKAGYKVMGVDEREDLVEQINHKTLRSPEPKVTEFLRNSLHFQATSSLEAGLAFSRLCFITLPSNCNQTALLKVLQNIYPIHDSDHHFVICTAVTPGTLSRRDGSMNMSYNPLFVAEGRIIEHLLSPDLILIGEQDSSLGDSVEAVYRTLCGSVEIARMTIASAEIAKLAINTFISMKIVYANLIAEIANETGGANEEKILRAIGKDQRVGEKYLQAGYGYGGPSLSSDPNILSSYASRLGLQASLFQAIEQTNEEHAEWLANRLLHEEREEYIFENVCYKPNCPQPITEKSPKLSVAKKIAEHGEKVVILDTEGVLKKVQQEYSTLFHYTPKT